MAEALDELQELQAAGSLFFSGNFVPIPSGKNRTEIPVPMRPMTATCAAGTGFADTDFGVTVP